MIKVAIESPYAGNVGHHLKYLHEACLDCLRRGESPYASHGFFTHFLNDLTPAERTLGIEAGLVWAAQADVVAVYWDLGISPGMSYAIEKHEQAGRKIEYRRLPGWGGANRA